VVCSFGLGADLDTLRLRPSECIVIVAPHPDDEVLGCGGLIQQALALEDKVWVVYVTSGDGDWPAAWRITGNLLPGPQEYVALGRARTEEARAGAGILGLDSTHLIFQGFPDGDLARVVFEHYYSETPLASSHTELDHSPYDYTGGAMVDQLYAEILRHQADRVFFPHPLDVHPDHWAAGALLTPVKELWRLGQTMEFPVAYYYPIHRPGYPRPDREDELHPPTGLTGPGHHWYTLPVEIPEVARKRQAYDCHWSQLIEAGPDPRGYMARNELFELVEADSGTTAGDAPVVDYGPIPRIESLTASVPHGSPAVFTLYLRGPQSSLFDYTLYLRSSGPRRVARVIDLAEDSSDRAQAMLRRIASGLTPALDIPVCARTDTTLTAYIPAEWFAGEDRLFFAAGIRWRERFINHTGVGSVAP